MDQQGFRTMLVNRNVFEDRLAPALALAARFDDFLSGKPATAETAWSFSKILIEEGSNTEDNYITLIRYCRFIQNHYETKIPYMTQMYLAETDPTLRRYYYCHCPWAREAIKHGDVRLAETFCNCSGGFHKKTFEVIFKQPLKVEVLESVLKGDDRCRFAIHLPSEARLP